VLVPEADHVSHFVENGADGAIAGAAHGLGLCELWLIAFFGFAHAGRCPVQVDLDIGGTLGGLRVPGYPLNQAREI